MESEQPKSGTPRSGAKPLTAQARQRRYRVANGGKHPPHRSRFRPPHRPPNPDRPRNCWCGVEHPADDVPSVSNESKYTSNQLKRGVKKSRSRSAHRRAAARRKR